MSKLSDMMAYEMVNERLGFLGLPRIKSPSDVADIGLGVGMTNANKEIRLINGDEIILRWVPADMENPEDMYFGGARSIQREAEILEIARKQAGLPAAEVIDVHENQSGKILIVKKVPGVTLHEYQNQNGHCLEKFLGVVYSLGYVLARAHSVKFENFGSIQPQGIVPGVSAYGLYLKQVIGRHLNPNDLSLLENYYTSSEIQEIFRYFEGIINSEPASVAAPSLVLYDQHDRNFMVNETGEVSGLFDLEFSQAAHPSLEMGSVSPQILGYYPDYVEIARQVLFEGYENGGGDVALISNTGLETVHVANHLFSAIKGYHKRKDGIRDTWSQKMAGMILDIVRSGRFKCHSQFASMVNMSRNRVLEPKRA